MVGECPCHPKEKAPTLGKGEGLELAPIEDVLLQNLYRQSRTAPELED